MKPVGQNGNGRGRAHHVARPFVPGQKVLEIDGRTVLLVEDDPPIRALVKTYLERMGLSVMEAADGRSALRKLKQTVPALVCLDLMLPELSGYEVCEFIRQTPALRDLPVMVMSGRALPNDRAHAAEVGASAYLIKPFSHREFCDQVSALLGTFAAANGNSPRTSQFYSHSTPSWQRAGTSELLEGRLLGRYLRYVFAALRRRRLLSAAVFLIVLAGAIASLFLLPKTYLAETRILAQRNQLMPGVSTAGQTRHRDADAPMQAASETILRRDNLIVLIKQTELIDSWRVTRAPLKQLKDDLFAFLFGSLTNEDKLNMLVGTLEKKLRVTPGEGTVTIGISWPDAQMAYRLVEAVEQNFLETRHVSEVSNLVEVISILEGHASNTRQSIEAILEKIQRVGESNPTKAEASLLARLASREAQDRQLVELKVMLQAKRRQIQDLEDFRHRRLAELTRKLAEQKGIYPLSRPAIVNLEQTITALSRESPKLADLHEEERELLSEYRTRGGSTDEISADGGLKPSPLTPQPMTMTRAGAAIRDDLSLDYAKARLATALSKYDSLLERIDAAQIELETARAAFKNRYVIVRAPQVPSGAGKPNVGLVIAGGFASGLILAVFAAIAAELRARRNVDSGKSRAS